MIILLMVIVGYSWLFQVKLSQVIGGYYIDGYWWLNYHWLLVVILLQAIGGYFIDGYSIDCYQWLLY